MQLKHHMAAAIAATTIFGNKAQTEIQWWHSLMSGPGRPVNDLAKEYNASQTQYKIVPTYKGQYDESMTAAIAAFRAGNAPDILQVSEVARATMMAFQGAVVPVTVMNDGGFKFDQGEVHLRRGRLLHRPQRPDDLLEVLFSQRQKVVLT